VAKHGNRAASSRCGSADVLSALGVNLELTPEQVAQCIDDVGIGFLFAARLHPSMKHAIGVRRELGVRTIFNILGPLTNPAGAPNILMGVFHPDLVGIQARVLKKLGSKRALVGWGRDGVDEISLGERTLVGVLRNGEINEYEIAPEDFGLARAPLSALRVDDPAASKTMLLEAIDGGAGAASDVVALNAGAALYAAGVAVSIQDGLARARAEMVRGTPRAKLDAFVALTQAKAREGVRA